MIIGIDPGLRGGIGIVSDNGGFVDVHPMPVDDGTVDMFTLFDLISIPNVMGIFVEEQCYFPKHGVRQGGTSTHTNGKNYGIVLCAARLICHDTAIYRPQEWKYALGLKGQPKEASRQLALKLFPESATKLTHKKHDGLAEALLIAYYALNYRMDGKS